jgi:hypothetical protein
VHVAAVGFQIEDRITDELTRAVERDVAAAAGLEERDTFRRERVGRLEHVRSVVPCLRAERDDGWMFEEQQLVGNAPLLALLDERVLQIERRLVFDRAEAPDFEVTSA